MILRISINWSTTFSKSIDRFVYFYRLAFDNDRLVGNFGQLSNPTIEIYQVCWVFFHLGYVRDQLIESVQLYIYILVSKIRVFNLLCFFASSYFLVFFVSFIGYAGIPPNDL
jgi:hypothetical protein